jgi:lysozyme family protein
MNDLLSHLPGAPHVVAHRCFDAMVKAGQQRSVPDLTESALGAFALELDGVVFAVPYEALEDDTPMTRLGLCRVTYRELRTSVGEIARARP